jgi:predicted nuclease of predicted toxin-antitoxin system
MSRKRQPFILDKNLGEGLKNYLPRGARTTVECGLPPHAPDDPDVVDLCQRERAILVTADIEFPKHFRKYQKAHNDCCWGLLLLPAEEQKQINVLKRLAAGKLILKHPKDDIFRFEDVRMDNLLVNLRADPPVIAELCSCEWAD